MGIISSTLHALASLRDGIRGINDLEKTMGEIRAIKPSTDRTVAILREREREDR